MLNKRILSSFLGFAWYVVNKMKFNVIFVFLLNTMSYVFFVLVNQHLFELITEEEVLNTSIQVSMSFFELITTQLFNKEIAFGYLVLWVISVGIAEASNAFAQYMSGRIYAETEYHTRMYLMEYIYHCTPESISKCPGEALLENYTDLLAEAIRELIEKFSHDILPAIVFIIIAIVYLGSTVSATLGIILTGIICFFGAFRYVQMKSIIKYVKNISAYSSERTRAIVEALQNILSVQSFRGDSYSIQYVNKAHLKETDNYRTYTEKAAIHTFFADFINNLCRWSIFFLLIFGKSFGVMLTSHINAALLYKCGNIISWILYTTSEKSKDLVDAVQSFGQANKSLSFFHQLEFDDMPETVMPSGYEIVLNNVEWSYSSNHIKIVLNNTENDKDRSYGKTAAEANDDYVLRDLSLVVKEGTINAVAGASGIGKSTLFNLMSKRLVAMIKKTADDGTEEFIPKEGQIFIGGQDICKLTTNQIRDLVSYLDQTDNLFDASIKDNIVLDRNCTEEEYMRTIKISGLTSLIESKGNDFIIGKRGLKISGGERRRVSIARALLKPTKILILDEMNTAIDPNTYTDIFRDILHYVKENKVTLFVIDHYNTLNRCCDNVVFLQKRCLPVIGNHNELMENCKKYNSYFMGVNDFQFEVEHSKDLKHR